jgi:hypothetical protein
MQPLDIAVTSCSPLIRFEPESATLFIAGESFPENSFEFYEPVMNWLQEALEALPGLRLDINVNYMNSSSTKCMLDLLDLLEEATQKGKSVSARWTYDKDNSRSRELAEEFMEEITFPFSIEPLEG